MKIIQALGVDLGNGFVKIVGATNKTVEPSVFAYAPLSMFANGTDYIVLAGKQVNKISGQTMWFSLKEDERLILNSAIVDSFLSKGTKLVL